MLVKRGETVELRVFQPVVRVDEVEIVAGFMIQRSAIASREPSFASRMEIVHERDERGELGLAADAIEPRAEATLGERDRVPLARHVDDVARPDAERDIEDVSLRVPE